MIQAALKITATIRCQCRLIIKHYKPSSEWKWSWHRCKHTTVYEHVTPVVANLRPFVTIESKYAYYTVTSISPNISFIFSWDISGRCSYLEADFQTMTINYQQLDSQLLLPSFSFTPLSMAAPQHMVLLLDESVEQDSSSSFFLFCRRALSRVTPSVWV